MGFSRQEVGWVEEAGTERDGKGTVIIITLLLFLQKQNLATAIYLRVRQLPPDKLGTRRSAARGPWAAPGGREHLEKPGCVAAA